MNNRVSHIDKTLPLCSRVNIPPFTCGTSKMPLRLIVAFLCSKICSINYAARNKNTKRSDHAQQNSDIIPTTPEPIEMRPDSEVMSCLDISARRNPFRRPLRADAPPHIPRTTPCNKLCSYCTHHAGTSGDGRAELCERGSLQFRASSEGRP